MSNLFNNISSKQKEKIYHILQASTINYSSDVNILSNANKQEFIGIIENGKLELAYNDYEGNKTIIDILEKDDIFGSLLINIASDELTCITKEKATITYIEYDKIIEKNNLKQDYYFTFIKNLLLFLKNQIIEKNERIELLTKKTTRDKHYYFSADSRIPNNTLLLRVPYDAMITQFNLNI